MVNDKTFRRFHNFPVNRNEIALISGFVKETNGIDTAGVIFFRRPVEFIEQVEDIGVNDSVKALAEGDFSKRQAVFVLPKLNHRPGEDFIEPVRDVNFYSCHCHVLLLLKNSNI